MDVGDTCAYSPDRPPRERPSASRPRRVPAASIEASSRSLRITSSNRHSLPPPSFPRRSGDSEDRHKETSVLPSCYGFSCTRLASGSEAADIGGLSDLRILSHGLRAVWIVARTRASVVACRSFCSSATLGISIAFHRSAMSFLRIGIGNLYNGVVDRSIVCPRFYSLDPSRSRCLPVFSANTCSLGREDLAVVCPEQLLCWNPNARSAIASHRLSVLSIS